MHGGGLVTAPTRPSYFPQEMREATMEQASFTSFAASCCEYPSSKRPLVVRQCRSMQFVA
eukprot:9497390-Pyramimonas_sp.AAC.1